MDKGTRKALTLSAEMLQEIDDYRRRQRPIPTESEAIRQLLRIGLDAVAPEQPRAP